MTNPRDFVHKRMRELDQEAMSAFTKEEISLLRELVAERRNILAKDQRTLGRGAEATPGIEKLDAISNKLSRMKYAIDIQS